MPRLVGDVEMWRFADSVFHLLTCLELYEGVFPSPPQGRYELPKELSLGRYALPFDQGIVRCPLGR